jgi:hypothetical protein
LQYAFGRWVRLFDETFGDKLITSPQLGNPSDGRFKYPVNRSRSMHKTVNEMCIAEANLDTSWRHVDFNVQKFADEEELATPPSVSSMEEGSCSAHRRGTRDHVLRSLPLQT